MNLRDVVKRMLPDDAINAYRRSRGTGDITEFRFDSVGPDAVKADIIQKYGFEGDLLDFFTSNRGSVVHKWHHYLPIYDRYFSPYRGRKIRFLEIGVSKGGSLQLWRQYFGDEAIIYGIDIDPACKAFDGQAGQVRIGSQVDETFLGEIILEMGGIDIVLDDGSHHMQHIPATLNFLFPRLAYGGLYMIEDLHTAYWKAFGGGYRSRGNFFRLLADVTDDMHRWYHARQSTQKKISEECSGIHIHDSIVVLEKAKVFKPVHSAIG